MDRTAEQIEKKAKALTLVFTALEILEPIDYSGLRVVIDTEDALYHADRVGRLDARTLPEAITILKAGEMPRVWSDDWKRYSRGPRALIGRIDLHHKLSDKGVRLVHRQPEDGLLPSQIVELGELFAQWIEETK